MASSSFTLSCIWKSLSLRRGTFFGAGSGVLATRKAIETCGAPGLNTLHLLQLLAQHEGILLARGQLCLRSLSKIKLSPKAQ